MATATDWARVRLLLNEPDDSNGWTDERIDELLTSTANPDGSLDFNATAAEGWRQKAATLTTLVSITENGSSRSSEQEFEHALAMAKMYGSAVSDETGSDSLPRPRSTRIVRPTRNG